MAIDVIIGILFALAGTSGLKQNVCCLKCPISGFPSAIELLTTRQTPFFEIPDVRLQLSEWLVTLHLYVWRYVQNVRKWLHTLPSHPTWSKREGSSWATLRAAAHTPESHSRTSRNSKSTRSLWNLLRVRAQSHATKRYLTVKRPTIV